MRSLLLTLTLLFCAGAAFAQTVLLGTVKDEKGEALIGASVKVLKGTDLVKGSITDYEGKFRISIDPGSYDVEVSYTGYKANRTTGVQVLANKSNYMDDVVMAEGNVLEEVEIKAYKIPLVKQDQTEGGQAFTAEDIKKLPTRSVNAIVATTAGTSSIDGGAVNIKGSRSNATNYYIDGIRVSGSTPPVQDIEQLSVITGGLGAEYGDVTGGVISVVTKGPASEYHGAIEVENSHGLDPYGWLLATANVSGPIIKKRSADGKSQRTILGFRLSGQYNSQKDDSPSALPIYQVKESVRRNLAENPLYLSGTVPVQAAQRLTQDSIERLNYRPNENRRDIDLTGKLDLRLTDNMDLSVTGTYKDVQNQFTPGGWGILNRQNNPTQYDSRYRVIGRFRHRLGGSNPEEKSSANKVSISNANYQLQFGFERGNSNVNDPRHGDRLFDYGYIGRFDFTQEAITGPNEVTGGYGHIGNFEQFNGFTPGYVNAQGQTVIPNAHLLPYNKFALDAETPGAFNTYIARNGFFSAVYDDVWSGMYSNINLNYNSVSKSENDIITIMASTGFDLKLGKSGVHSIQVGILNEQRVNRGYAIAPVGLWNLIGQSVNIHLSGLDTNQVIGKIFDERIQDSVSLYANGVLNPLPSDVKFYRSIRQSLGLNINDYVNGYGLTPDQVTLDMFSPRELTDQQLMDYTGYDYLGNKTPDGILFEDFFTSRDAQGVRNFPVAPFRPLYQAAYIKDKFTFNRMIFNIGLRVERFDLNTKVLRDPYSLYEIKSAGQYFAENPQNRPGSIGDDFKVYVASEQDLTPTAFRDGDQWYFPDGRQANDGNLVFGSTPVFPLLADPVSNGDIFSENFDVDKSFEDYTPQVNVLPRLAFSFPISKEANFFAHYDILVQRPTDNSWQVTPLDYLYFYTAGRTPGNNANLRPERVVDYEVGFQQLLNKNSAIKFSAYYREMRDMVQVRTYNNIPIISRYETFGNIDFGTVKGFTVQYDLRRIQNAELRLAYTLQFADGTGSDLNSQRGLTTRGNLRTLYPLNFDERHSISTILDYRFDSGSRYNGPSIGGVDILANFGANFQVNAVSGRPYTAKIRPVRFGGDGTVGALNGNRLPWRLNVDLRLDKSFALTSGNKKPLNLNVYLRVANLLNRKNILGVYSATGSPYDDGYLATAEGQSILDGVVQQGASLDAYLASYSWIMLNGGFFSLPRRIYVGALFEF